MEIMNQLQPKHKEALYRARQDIPVLFDHRRPMISLIQN